MRQPAFTPLMVYLPGGRQADILTINIFVLSIMSWRQAMSLSRVTSPEAGDAPVAAAPDSTAGVTGSASKSTFLSLAVASS